MMKFFISPKTNAIKLLQNFILNSIYTSVITKNRRKHAYKLLTNFTR